MLKHIGNCSIGTHVSAKFCESMTNFRNGAISIVGHTVDHDRRSARTITLVTNFNEINAIRIATALLDGALDVVLGHALRLGSIHCKPQSRVGRDITAAQTRCHGNFPDEFGEKFATLFILGTFAMLDIGPFAMSCHLRVIPASARAKSYLVSRTNIAADKRFRRLIYIVRIFMLPEPGAYDNGYKFSAHHLKLRQMPDTEQETHNTEVTSPDFIQRARNLLDNVPNQEEIRAARLEGEEICHILKPLGLPRIMEAAVHLYPAARDGMLDDKALQKTAIPELPNLVQGLVQLGNFTLPIDWKPGEALATQQSEALRKMLLAVVSDARLVVARIAEQLYRLRQAKRAAPDIQRATAIQTQEIYAPLANRLGIWQLKWELEDLAFRFLEQETYTQIAKALKEKRVEREEFIGGVTAKLKEALWNNGIHAEITGRPKHIYSIWRKMQRKNAILEQIFDIRAVRILVDDVGQCYAALGIVHNIWAYLPGEFDDYIANPKSNDYQSLHTALIGPDGQIIEVQIRSHDMHRHAELGVAAHWRYKEGGASKAAFEKKIQMLRHLLEPADADVDLFDQIRGDVFEDRVYAVSPKGDVVEMPSGATPLDFAYHVHTQVGHRCRGAKVNGRIVPLTYQVQNGDKIEIITSKEEPATG